MIYSGRMRLTLLATFLVLHCHPPSCLPQTADNHTESLPEQGNTFRLKLFSGKLVHLGMTKVRVHKKSGRSGYPRKADIWDYKETTDRTHQTIRLSFKDNLLIDWDKLILLRYADQRNYPLLPEAIEKGMSMEDVYRRWGRPDYSHETNNLQKYSLETRYYLEKPLFSPFEPLELAQNMTKGNYATLVYDQNRKVWEVQVHLVKP